MGGVRAESLQGIVRGGAVKQVQAKAARQTLRGIRGQLRGADVKHFLGKTQRPAADQGGRCRGKLRLARLCQRQVVAIGPLGGPVCL